MLFLAKFFILAAVVAILVRAGMHAQQLTTEGISPWGAHGMETIGAMLHTDFDTLSCSFWTPSSVTC